MARATTIVRVAVWAAYTSSNSWAVVADVLQARFGTSIQLQERAAIMSVPMGLTSVCIAVVHILFQRTSCC
jgi:hypothetical protein